MKVRAVLLSPLAGALGVVLSFIFWSIVIKQDLSMGFSNTLTIGLQAIGLIYIIGLIIQIVIVETIMLVSNFHYSLIEYCWLAFLLSFCFTVLLSINLGMEFLGMASSSFSLYSIGNILTYNQLYFKYLEKKNDLDD